MFIESNLLTKPSVTRRLAEVNLTKSDRSNLPVISPIQQLVLEEIYLELLNDENLAQASAEAFIALLPIAVTGVTAQTADTNSAIILNNLAYAYQNILIAKENPTNRRSYQRVKKTVSPQMTEFKEKLNSNNQLIQILAANFITERQSRKKPQPTLEQLNQVKIDKLTNVLGLDQLPAGQAEFIVRSKLVGVYNPSLETLIGFKKQLIATEFEGRVKLDVCAGQTVGSLGQLLPNPNLDIKYYRITQEAVLQTKALKNYQLDAAVTVADWQQPLRWYLYRALSEVSDFALANFGITRPELDQILTEYPDNAQSIFEACQTYMVAVRRELPDTQSSLELLAEIYSDLPRFFADFSQLIIKDFLLPRLSSAQGITAYLESINLPFTDKDFITWLQYYGIGNNVQPQQEALWRSLRLDSLFYFCQYQFEKWQAEKNGFMAIITDEADAQMDYQPTPANFPYPSNLPVMPLPKL